jgi:NAD(P)-dependent dehydrogenase (short-subunit alcohol dehydrogenase family)
MKDKLAIVTGGAVGIGRAACLRFAADAAAVTVTKGVSRGDRPAQENRREGDDAHRRLEGSRPRGKERRRNT